MRRLRSFQVVPALLAVAGHAGAQGPTIPIRALVVPTASSAETLGTVLRIRALSDGRVIVNDFAHRRVMLFDSSLTSARVVIDTAGGSGSGGPLSIKLPSATLLRYVGDSTLYPDRRAQSLLVLDANGLSARVMALPSPQDLSYLTAYSTGDPAIDPRGRLIYRARFHAKPLPPQPNARTTYPFPVQADSAPIVRADFDTRHIDTIATLRLNPSVRFTHLETDASGDITAKYTATFLSVDDQWAMLSDGTLAVVSVHDYHIEWTDPDGRHRASPKMPFDWKPLDSARKQSSLDSLRREMDRLNGSPPRPVSTPEGPHTIRTIYEVPPADKIGDFEQPLQVGSVVPDRQARLWIVPHSSASARGGLLYDVVDRDGVIAERVQFPKDRVLLGFGDHDDVYVSHVDGATAHLERYDLRSIRRP